jgi:hypothetical protein
MQPCAKPKHVNIIHLCGLLVALRVDCNHGRFNPLVRMRNGQSLVKPCPLCQTSTCSAIAIASSTSMPKCLTVLSIFGVLEAGGHPYEREDRRKGQIRGSATGH